MSLKSKFRRFKGIQTKEECKYFPKSNYELKNLIRDRVNEDPECDLNDVWVGDVEDMSYLFCDIKFNGDISRWDVGKVKNMSGMFRVCIFDGDISDWNVSNVEDMGFMFKGSKFDGDISQWDVRNVKSMYEMFRSSPFNGDISDWDVRKVEENEMVLMFHDCPLQENPPKWYKDEY